MTAPEFKRFNFVATPGYTVGSASVTQVLDPAGEYIRFADFEARIKAARAADRAAAYTARVAAAAAADAAYAVADAACAAAAAAARAAARADLITAIEESSL